MGYTQNTKNGLVTCLWGIICSLLTVFFWGIVSYSGRGYGAIRFSQILSEGIVTNTLALFLVGGIVCAGIALYKIIDGLINKKNNCLIALFLVLTNLVTSILILTYRAGSKEANAFLVCFLHLFGIFLAFIGTLVSYSKQETSENKPKKTSTAKKLEELDKLLADGTITQEEWTNLRKDVLSKTI